MARLGVKTRSVPAENILPVLQAARAGCGTGLWFEESAPVLDPLQIVRVFASAAVAHGTIVQRDGGALTRLELHGICRNRFAHVP
jgi:hypothetical protein